MSPCTARRSNQSILKEISPGLSLEGMKKNNSKKKHLKKQLNLSKNNKYDVLTCPIIFSSCQLCGSLKNQPSNGHGAAIKDTENCHQFIYLVLGFPWWLRW